MIAARGFFFPALAAVIRHVGAAWWLSTPGGAINLLGGRNV